MDGTIREPIESGTRLVDPGSPLRPLTVKATSRKNEYEERLYRVHIAAGTTPSGYWQPGGWLGRLYTVQDFKDWGCREA